MILVLSLNTAIDKTHVIPGFRTGRLFRPELELELPGGKGMNVARVLRHCGAPVRVIGCVAGSAGEFIKAKAREEGISAEWIEIPRGQSRTCLAVVDGLRHQPTEINEAGPELSSRDVERVRRRVMAALPRARMLVCSGSLPRGVPADFYAGLIRAAHALGVKTVLDTSGPALTEGLRASPTILKPNETEMRSLQTGLGGKAAHAHRSWLEFLLECGVCLAVITLGHRGLVAADAEHGRSYRLRSPRLRSLNPIGSGDTLLAGILAGCLRGWDLQRTLRYAAAMAAANTLVPGAGVFKDSDRKRLLPLIRIEPLK